MEIRERPITQDSTTPFPRIRRTPMNNIYLEGYYAFKKHLPQSDNPYKEESEKQQWHDGWKEAKMEAAKRECDAGDG
jgi:ribosome modulation factor